MKSFLPFEFFQNNKGRDQLKNPLIIALDTDDLLKVKKLVKILGPYVGGFKLGPRLILKYGQDLMEEVSLQSPVFLDCKFFDIQSTVISSVKTGFYCGASMISVHALNSVETLKALYHLEMELNVIRPFRILCVTVLTDWDENDLPHSVWKESSLEGHVRKLADRAWSSGLRSLVCSPKELKVLWDFAHLKKINPFFVTPGLRWGRNIGKDEQKRVVSPREALSLGASALVLGKTRCGSFRPFICCGGNSCTKKKHLSMLKIKKIFVM